MNTRFNGKHIYMKKNIKNMYNRKESEQMLIEKYKFRSTGEKHCENEFTKWFQSFYLFTKLGIDKRKAHYASLINAGQLDRKTAMELLQKSPEYPLLGIEARVMKYPKRRHEDYKRDWVFPLIGKIIRFLRKWKFMVNTLQV